MITPDILKQISSQLSPEAVSMADNDLSGDITRILYRVDQFRRHIDVEFCFGGFCEIPEGSPLFRQIRARCALPQGEQELVLYQK